jgi:calcium-dependent protein kinase
MGNHLPGNNNNSNLPQSRSHESSTSLHSTCCTPHKHHEQRRRTYSLQENLVRERDRRHKFEDIYEIVEDIGLGGLCEIYKIRKRDERVGGSSRPDLVRKQARIVVPALLSSPGSKVHKRYSTRSSSGNNGSFFFNNNSNGSSPASSSSNNSLYYALKVINLHLVAGGSEKINQLKNEVELLKTLDHRSIIKAYETFQRTREKQIVIVMELCTGGDLFARMTYTERQVAVVMKQVLSAINYMHDKNIIHRDVKMENILFESKHPDAAVKIIDFGVSKAFAKSESVLKERVGTLYSMSPETMQGHSTAQADLWSIGVCTFIMLSGGERPFEGATPKHLVAKVLLADYEFLPHHVWSNISDKAHDFVRNLLVVNPEQRMTAAQAIRHDWIALDRAKPSSECVDTELIRRVSDGIVRYAQHSEFRKLALNVIAKKSPPQEIFELRKVFDEFDYLQTGTITLEEFKNLLLSKFDYSEGMLLLETICVAVK